MRRDKPHAHRDAMNIRANVERLETCGARTRSGAPCRNARMRGRRRCRMHGGRSLSGWVHPSIRHGLDSADPFTRALGADSIRQRRRFLDGTPVRLPGDPPEAGVSDGVAQHEPRL